MSNLCFPKTVALVLDKHIKLYLGPCKIVVSLAGKMCLVSPVFGSGFYGTFNKKTGEFRATKDCKPHFVDLLQQVEDKGLAAVAEIGLLTGVCGICGRTLTAEESIAGGIGPICAGKVGYQLEEGEL